MDSVIDMEQARALVQNETLWRHVADFLWNTPAIVHPARIKAILDCPGIDATALAGSPFVKTYICEKLGIEPFFCEFPASSPYRIALLDGATLSGAAKWLGVIAFACELRKIMDGAKVREFKAAFPGVYPEAFAYTAYFRSLKAPAGAEISPDAIKSYGEALLQSVFADLPPQIRRRAEVRFEKDFTSPQGVSIPLETVMLVLKLKFPEAYKLCSS